MNSINVGSKARRENEDRVAEEYYSSLSDLNCNSKPLINMLTMLAEENIEYAPIIVKVVADHISKVPPDIKLPILYLIDSIVKNVKNTYTQLFSQCIVNIFCDVFEKVNEKIRERMYALRQTWNEVFSSQKLYTLDVRVKQIDNNWPITAKQPQPSIHVNPNFLKTVTGAQTRPTDMEEILHAKTRELLELKKRKLELELEATKKHLEEQEKQLSKTTETVMPVGNANAMALPAAINVGNMSVPISDTPSAMRARMFNANPQFRNNDSRILPISSVLPQQLETQASQTGKQKVYPVQPGLINTLRHRDPRLARQHQNVQNAQNELDRKASNNTVNNHASNSSRQNDEEGMKNKESTSTSSSSSSRLSHKSGRSRSSKTESGSESKSPIRHSPSRSSSGRSGKSYSSRDKSCKERSDRKRSDSKSSTSSPLSSASSSTSLDRRKINISSSLSAKSYDKDAFEIVPLATAMGHKASNQNPSSSTTTSSLSPSSPTAMPSSLSTTTKLKMNAGKRMQQQQHLLSRNSSSSSMSNNNNSSGGGSRHKNVHAQSAEEVNPNKDIDLRKSIQTNVTVLSDQVIEPVDSHDDDIKKTDTMTAAAQPSILSLDDKTSSALDHRNNNPDIDDEMKSSNIAWKERLMTVDDSEEVTKKRPSNSFEENEPATKKCKAASKLDILFGEEDVDLRTLPGQIIVQQQQPPPPPNISEKEKREMKLKPQSGMKIQVHRKATSTTSHLDDVRAKLAKAAKSGSMNNNKLKKSEKEKANNRDLNQHLKLTDLNMNDDSQEDNDEKIRTIVTQAQELLETNSISQEQYKQLVQTVMSINENNKLKEAKRRESLNMNKAKHDVGSNIAQDDNDDSNDSEMERREAVLKKRIPKLKTPSEAKANKEMGQMRNTENAHFAEATKSEIEANVVGKLMNKPNSKDKPLKMKWNDRVNAGKKNQDLSMSNVVGNQMNQKSSWLMGTGGGKIGVNRFGASNINSNTIPSNQVSIVNANQRIPQQLPWNIQGSMAPAAAIPMMCNGIIPAQPALPNVIGMGMTTMTKPCNSIDNPQADMVRSIKIDNMAKEIRIYDEVAIVFMELDQPREIGFKAGKRDIFIDNQEPISLHFNDTYRTFNIAGQPYRLRFGFPSRELYIDDNWYEIYFGGPPVLIPLNNSVHCLKAEGPPPQVNIGPIRRDLVVGKINMIVDAHIVVPLFLDSKVQTFYLGDKQHTIQFADNLLTVLLDGEPIQVEYGGLPKKYVLSGSKCFIRFGTLPQGIIAGKVNITNMIYVKTAPPVVEQLKPDRHVDSLNDKLLLPPALDTMDDNKDMRFTNTLPIGQDISNEMPNAPPSLPSAAALKNLNIDDIFQKLISFGILGSNSTIATKTNVLNSGDSDKNVEKKTSTATVTATASTAEVAEPVVREIIVPIDLCKSESVKTRQSSIVNRLFSGMQCSSCGLRFSLEHTIKYSQHLDWHFRQNRRERDTSRKAHSRKWYYEFNDWVQYEEIEDIEEKEKNFFETQQNDVDSNDDASTNRLISNSPIQSCPAGPDDLDRVCDMCQEKFEHFYHEELEEWHLRTAIRVEDKIYHPLCYNDFKASIASHKAEEKGASQDAIMVDAADVADDNATDILIGLDEDMASNDVIPTEDIDDDDVIVLPNEEPLITEIEDDDDDHIEKTVQPSTTENVCVDSSNAEIQLDTTENNLKEAAFNDTAESDVEIQEPHIPFTDLDTYVEKELPALDESTQGFFGDIKIKEEPKEDDEEDDGFEDVGTVLIPSAEEITLQEESTCQSVDPTVFTDSPMNGSPLMNNNNNNKSGGCDTNEPTDNTKDPQISMDGNLESEIEHNLSATGMMTPAIPLASLVNKIKINMTKNTALNSSDTPTTSSSSATTGGVNHTSSNKLDNSEILSDTTASIGSTIPVLCSGSSSTSTAISNIPIIGGATNGHSVGGIGVGIDGFGASSTLMGSVSTISVIGSYGSNIGSSATESQHQTPLVAAAAKSSANSQTQQQPSEPAIVYELKPSLKEVTLKKTPSISCGVETSGLCSIM